MPRFFFHLFDDIHSPDPEGRHLPDLKVAQSVALQEAREIAAEGVRNGKLDLAHRIEVADDRGQVLHVARFADAVQILC